MTKKHKSKKSREPGTTANSRLIRSHSTTRGETTVCSQGWPTPLLVSSSETQWETAAAAAMKRLSHLMMKKWRETERWKNRRSSEPCGGAEVEEKRRVREAESSGRETGKTTPWRRSEPCGQVAEEEEEEQEEEMETEKEARQTLEERQRRKSEPSVCVEEQERMRRRTQPEGWTGGENSRRSSESGLLAPEGQTGRRGSRGQKEADAGTERQSLRRRSEPSWTLVLQLPPLSDRRRKALLDRRTGRKADRRPDRKWEGTERRTDRKWEETEGRTDRKLEETEGWTERKWEETEGRTDRKWEETEGRTDRKWEETERRTDRKWEETEGRTDRKWEETERGLTGSGKRQRDRPTGSGKRTGSCTEGRLSRVPWKSGHQRAAGPTPSSATDLCPSCGKTCGSHIGLHSH